MTRIRKLLLTLGLAGLISVAGLLTWYLSTRPPVPRPGSVPRVAVWLESRNFVRLWVNGNGELELLWDGEREPGLPHLAHRCRIAPKDADGMPCFSLILRAEPDMPFRAIRTAMKSAITRCAQFIRWQPYEEGLIGAAEAREILTREQPLDDRLRTFADRAIENRWNPLELRIPKRPIADVLSISDGTPPTTLPKEATRVVRVFLADADGREVAAIGDAVAVNITDNGVRITDPSDVEPANPDNWTNPTVVLNVADEVPFIWAYAMAVHISEGDLHCHAVIAE